MVALAKWLGLQETNHQNEYWDPTIFLFTSDAAIIFFL